VNEHHREVYWISKSIHRVVRFRRRTLLFLAALGPGIITMIADNDAGGISTYAQTGAKSGFSLLWTFIILVPMAYYVQEMTVRLGAVTKRGHAEDCRRILLQSRSRPEVEDDRLGSTDGGCDAAIDVRRTVGTMGEGSLCHRPL